MKSKKLIVGIPGYNYHGGGFFGAGVNYLKLAKVFGDARIIMPTEEKVKVDLLILPGGLDLSPDSYDEVPDFNTSNQDVMKEFFFRKRLQNYIEDTPIFGICLGFQMLGVKFGSKLTQHLMYHEDSPDRWQPAHSVTVCSNDIEKDDEEFDVNSHHHQAILKSNLSDKLEMLAYARCDEIGVPDDEVIVEAFRHTTLPIAGVQWHPEEWYDEFSLGLVESLLKQNGK